MQLWNDYEGRTIADIFPLNKLLAPEGRSAFFSTTNGTGTPGVIRLIEAHFDEGEILDRWRQVADIKQPNLVILKKYGQTVVDGTPLVYALLETTDANLAEILQDRPLTVEETSQIATSLVPALQALHSRNLIHEHIEPANVLAVGEVIKLRSDCIREAPEGQEGLDLKAHDVHNLAIVLLQSLTQQRTLPPGTVLPAPFNQIIPNGISGAWGLPQIAAALSPGAASLELPATRIPPAAAPAPTPIASQPIAPASPLPESTSPVPLVRDRIVRPVDPVPSRRLGLWIAGAIGVLLLLLLGWYFLHAAPSSTTKDTTQPISTPTTAVNDASAPTPASPPPAATAMAPSPAPVPSSDSRNQWRVVAYTYNHQDQAQQKANLIAKRHPDLNPEVFTPSGHAPFLVTVGGPMSRVEANAFKNKAYADGLPRDIYTQNYTR
jgi:eukaryotic-like serine/threonine-protein kinase